jgi:hypothetical protein
VALSGCIRREVALLLLELSRKLYLYKRGNDNEAN